MVVHIAIAALLVLEQEGRAVERRELDEPEVHVPEEAPVRHGGSERREARAAATDDDVGRGVEPTAVMVGSILDTPILQVEKLSCHASYFVNEFTTSHQELLLTVANPANKLTSDATL